MLYISNKLLNNSNLNSKQTAPFITKCNKIIEELEGSLKQVSKDRQLDRSIMDVQTVLKEGCPEEQDYMFELVFDRFQFFIKKQIANLFVVNTDRADIMQEATMCFYNSILDYNIEKGAFIFFTRTYIRRNIYSLISKSRRHVKNNVTFVSIDSFCKEESKNNYDDHLFFQVADNINIEDDLVIREDTQGYLRHMEDILTDREKKAMYLYLKGASYEQIADVCAISEKSVDNSLHRAKSKLKAVYKKDDI